MRHLVLFLLAGMLLFLGCDGDSGGGTGDASDSAASSAQEKVRVVSFLPSITRMFFDMGLGEYLVGVTRFCTLPEGEHRPVVGDMLNLRVEPIIAVDPDYFLAQAAEDKLAPLREMCPDLHVEHMEVETLADISRAMVRIGEIVGEPEVGEAAAAEFEGVLEETRERVAGLEPKSVVFMMFSFGYSNPLCAGGNTYLDEMLTIAGGQNVMGDRIDGWDEVGMETIISLRPEVVICQCGEEQAADVRAYWEQLGRGEGWEKEVFVVTEDDWTVPAGHIAGYTADLADMLHGGATNEGE